MRDRDTEAGPEHPAGGGWLSGGGEMGERIRALDWSRTPLGPMSEWPGSLKTSVRIMLTSSQPIWIGWGPDLIYLYNDPYRSIIGGKHPTMLGQPTSVVWREIWDDIGPMLATAMGGEEGIYVESQLLIMERYGYREETYYTFSYSPIPDDEGHPGGIFCANTDDTQRVISERQLALLRELGAQTAEARSWQVAAERSGQALSANPYDLPFALIYVAEPGADGFVLAGSSGVEPGHPAVPKLIDSREAPWRLGELVSSREPVLHDSPVELSRAMVSNGAWSEPPARVALVPIPASGQTGRGGVMVVGLNPFRLFDAGYRNFLTLAAHQVAATIAASQAYEEERRRAEALAEIDRAKTTFFSNVSHEFRTPLTLMLGPLADALADPALDARWRQQLSLVQRNGLRLLKLVNSLLDFARIEAGRNSARFQPIDIATLTRDIASSFRSAVERAGLSYRIDCQPLDQPVYVDVDMWEKIVLNLLSNAFKFTLSGHIGVRLEVQDGHAVLSVSDSGVGIPDHEVPRLFERFHRVEGMRGRTLEGTGIGLALVHELVKLHAGVVDAESKVDVGTTIRVTIPLGHAHLPVGQVDPSGSQTHGPSSADAFVQEALRWLPGSDAELAVEPSIHDTLTLDADPPADGQVRARVLIADDNADMRDYLQRLLSQRFEVSVASDGNHALEAVRNARPDLVISDVMMPNLDGFGLIERLRDDPATASLPVILLSARAGEEATVEGLKAGANDYLVKPFSSRELLGRIEAQIQRIRFEQALHTADRRLRSALAAARMATWEWYPDTGALHLTESITDVLGLLPGTTLTATDHQGFAPVHPADAQRYRSELKALATGAAGSSYHLRFRIIRPIDQAVAWIEERGSKQLDEASGRDRVSAVSMDVTERVLSEQAAQESERRFFTMADTAPALLWIADPDGSCTFLSKGWYEYTGQTEQQSLGFGWLDAVHPDDRGATDEGYAKANDSRVAFELEYRLRRSDGEHRWVMDSGRPRSDPEGQFLGYIGSVIEIHARKQAEEQNTALLTSERAAREEAERVNLLKDEFLATLSHELRSPLNAIVGWSQILSREGIDAETARRGIETIQRNARVQTQMIEDLLDMSRIISGKVRLDVQRVDIADVIEQAVQSVLPSASGRSIRLLKVLDPQAGPVSGDPNRLQQIIWNLLSNAIKFTPKGGKVQVILERVNSHVEISVADDGEGITPDFLPHLFDRFRQADASTTRPHGGLGLGLSIVRQLVELHGGSVRAKSPGKDLGSTFVVLLPVAATTSDHGEHAARQHPRTQTRHEPYEPASLGGAKVLVVDDDPDARTLIGYMLRASAAKVLTAGSAAEAFELLRRERPDILLSDIGMPGEDGYDLIRRVRALPADQGGRTHAVALTAFARSEDRRRALNEGYHMHLAKPVEAAELLAVVNSLLERSEPSPER